MRTSTRILIGILLSLYVLLAAFTFPTPWIGDNGPICQEDNACWDCRTMGNHLCHSDIPLGTRLQWEAGPYAEVIYCGIESQCVVRSPAYIVEAK